MSEAINRVSMRSPTETESVLNRYNSLVHILNGEEEFLLDQNGLIIGSNLEAVNVTGYEEYEILGKHISIFYRPEEIGKANEDLVRAFQTGKAIVTGLRIKKRGVNFWAKMKIKYIEPLHSDSPCYRVVLQDATHRAISKERIRTFRDEYLAIFNNPFVGTFKFNMEGYSIQMCNQKTLEILGIQNSSNLRLDHFFYSLAQFELFISTLQQEKKIESFKFLAQHSNADGEIWVVISARYYEGQGFSEGVMFDITEQHRQMMELQRVNTELDNFIYHASHDLRSPLTSIMGLVHLGLHESSVEVAHTYLQMIQSRVDRLDILLKDLISVSYNNTTEKELSPFPFEQEIDSILKQLESPDESIKVTVKVMQQVEFRTDPVRIRTILRNLLSNSYTYFNPDAADPFIHITVRVGATHCAILLKDNGIGIHQKFKKKVYDMFFRGTDRSSGSGLGLYIVKSMVEKLNGKISFESTLNVGTTFLVTIPNRTSSSKSMKSNEPINYCMLTSRQIELVECSWDYILLNAQETGVIFYKKLFSLDPMLRQMFKDDIHIQSQKLVAMITFAVHKLNDLDEIVADVRALGIQHKNNQVEIGHYETVATALLWTLAQALGNDWNEEVEDAWTAVYTVLSKTMIEAARS